MEKGRQDPMNPASSSTNQRRSPTTARPRPFGLTVEQAALYDSVFPGVVDRAVGMVLATHPAWDHKDDLFQEGVLAIGVGIPTFDPARGAQFPQWAFWVAATAMLRVLRVERRHRRQIAALRVALALHAAFEAATGDALRDVIDLALTEATPYARRITAGTLARLSAEPPATDGEDGVVLREAQARLVEVLRRLVSELRPEQRALLRRRHATTLEEVARGPAPAKSYCTELRAYQAVIALLGARLAGAGIHELPPLPATGIETILGEDDPETAGPPSRIAA
jgi:RNA polymerase sigma factor (sigma-70 family)